MSAASHCQAKNSQPSRRATAVSSAPCVGAQPAAACRSRLRTCQQRASRPRIIDRPPSTPGGALSGRRAVPRYRAAAQRQQAASSGCIAPRVDSQPQRQTRSVPQIRRAHIGSAHLPAPAHLDGLDAEQPTGVDRIDQPAPAHSGAPYSSQWKHGPSRRCRTPASSHEPPRRRISPQTQRRADSRQISARSRRPTALPDPRRRRRPKPTRIDTPLQQLALP